MQKLEINTVALGIKIDMKLLGLLLGLFIVYFPFLRQARNRALSLVRYIEGKYNKITCFSQVAIGLSGRAFLESY
jgi:hypothetical protein